MLQSEKTYQAPPDSGKVVLGRTLPSLLDEGCDRAPNASAFNQWTDAGWKPISNQAFRTAAEEVALGLLDLSLEGGDRIALLIYSDVNFALADMGCLLADLVDVPIDLSQTIENIIFALQHSQAKAIVISNLDLFSQIAPYLPNAPDLKIVILVDVPADWLQVRSQLTLCQTHDEKEIPASTGLVIPQLLTNTHLDHLHPEIPECIQIFSLEEVRNQGLRRASEDNRQQMRSQLEAKNLATIIYISGVTGQLQGVMLTHENLSSNALASFVALPDLELGEKEVVLSFLPLTHVFARSLLYGHINYGHSVYFTTPNRVIKHLQEIRPTIFATVPLLLEKIYSHILDKATKSTTRQKQVKREVKRTQKTWLLFPRFHFLMSPFQFHFSHHFFEKALVPIAVRWALNLAKQYELGRKPKQLYAWQLQLADRHIFSQWRTAFGSRLKYLLCGGAALKAEVANLLAAAGIKVLQGYGLTETSAVVSYNRGAYNRAGTVGVPIAGVEIAIADDGEVLIRGTCVMQGYYKNPEATQNAIDADGWLHTGDLGEFTEDGFLKITGLKKSLFKLSTGKYVTPQPLESKLEQSYLVKRAIAVGSERKFCAMLIFPNLEALQEQAKTIGLDLPTEALLQHPCILALYQSLVDEANCHLPYWSTVRRFRLVNTETISIEEMKRGQILETFAKEIDALYEDVGRKGDEKTRGRGDAVRERGGEEENEAALVCPPITPATCPVYAQSLDRH
jgi:long-chain acyl-CoA synthetase